MASAVVASATDCVSLAPTARALADESASVPVSVAANGLPLCSVASLECVLLAL